MSPQTSVPKSNRALLGALVAMTVLVVVLVLVVAALVDHGSKQSASGPVVSPSSNAGSSATAPPSGPSTEDPMRRVLADNVLLKNNGTSECDWGFSFFHGVPQWKGEGDGRSEIEAVQIEAYRCFGRSELRGNMSPQMAIVPGAVDYDACVAAVEDGKHSGAIDYSTIHVGTTICGRSMGSLVWRLTLVSAPSSSSDPGVWKLTAWGLQTAAG